jgi:hypothetical protein
MIWPTIARELILSGMTPPTRRFALVFLAWGHKAMGEIQRFIETSPHIDAYDLILITDRDTPYAGWMDRFHAIARVTFALDGLKRKCELLDHLPGWYDAYCFLDTDTIVLGDISFGFEKALRHGIALSPAPHYSLDYFWGFAEAMAQADVAQHGQLQYNTGVIFFCPNHPGVSTVFQLWKSLAISLGQYYENDQPFFTLAMEMKDFNPYTLSIGYNYRGFGDSISGEVRIWHSHGNPPEELNAFPSAWPPRRAWPDRLESP